ncbi:MAG: NYN domain-containing protein [Candidatus Paceibacterota bacterium]
MKNNEDNVAYIDGANLHKGMKALDWEFDYGRFRVWLKEKYRIQQAYLFLGFIPKYKDLYTKLQEQGYTLVFKEVIFDGDGKAKGNCDADIVVHAMQDAYENKFNKVVLISSDGDYAPLVKFLKEKNKIEFILSPYDTKKCSILLKRTGVKISYISDQKNILKKST